MSILTYPAHLRRALQAIAARILPGHCLLCAADSRDDLLCAACNADLPPMPASGCPHCADRTTHGERCGACLKDPPFFDHTIACFHYDFPVDRIIHALKYGHQLAVASWCGRQLARRIATLEFDTIIPLPLHPDRLRERGFNQSGEIAKSVAGSTGIRLDRESLVRIRATMPQADLPHRERQGNVRGAFECRDDLSGKHVLLVDDVMTTAATANECARVLKLHGAASVTVGVMARALKT